MENFTKNLIFSKDFGFNKISPRNMGSSMILSNSKALECDKLVIRGRPIWVFLWPILIFRNQCSRWPIYDANFSGPICLAIFIFFHLIKSKSSNKKVK